MGVFYNPQAPMPISQMGFKSQIGGATGGGRAAKPEKKRDLAAEKQDAMAKASKISAGNPDKYAEVLTSLGYAEDAIQYKDKFAKAEMERLKVEELEVNQQTEQLRLASDLARSNREDLAMRVANKMIPDVENQYIRMKYNPKTDEVAFETHAGDTGSMNVDALIKAGTKSQVQFQEQAATYRTKLQTMKDPKQMTPTELLGVAMVKHLEIENQMGKTGDSYEDVIKKSPNLKLEPLEKTMILKWKQGDLTPVVAAMTAANPGMFKRYGAKTPEDDAKIVSTLFRTLQDALEKETTPNVEPQEGGGGAKPQGKKGGASASISTSERSHPAFTKPVTMKSPDGRTGKVAPENIDKAIKDGWEIAE